MDSKNELKGQVIQKKSERTNAERIRAMSDEELSLFFLCPAEYDLSFNKSCACNGEMNKDCRKCTLKWLQSSSI